jgi:hypothetical protein
MWHQDGITGPLWSRFDANLNQLDDEVGLDTNTATPWHAIAGRANGWTMTWDRSDGSGMTLTELDRDGVEACTPSTLPTQIVPDAIATHAGGHLVVGKQAAMGAQNVFALRFAPDCGTGSEPIALQDDGSSGSAHAEIAVGDRGLAVVWEHPDDDAVLYRLLGPLLCDDPANLD